METNGDQIQPLEAQTPLLKPGTYSLVTAHMQDTMGAIFWGTLFAILLIGWVRAEARNRLVIAQVSHERWRYEKPQSR